MTMTYVNKYLDDWLRLWERKILMEEMREVIDLRENMRDYGQYLSGMLLRKNRSIEWVKTNNIKLQVERKTHDQFCKRRKNMQKLHT
jgi:hypothetical protein